MFNIFARSFVKLLAFLFEVTDVGIYVLFLPTAARKVRKEKPLKEEGGLAVQKAASRILNMLQHLPLFKNSPPLPFGRIQNPMLTAEALNCQ